MKVTDRVPGAVPLRHPVCYRSDFASKHVVNICDAGHMATRVALMIWRGQTIECAVCATTAGWTVSTDGGRAWATCDAGHEVDHPLIYPDLVSAVAAGHLTRAESRALDWRPHWRDEDGAYRGWEVPGSVDWSTWPQLVRGRELDKAVAEWMARAETDMSAASYLTWGTTDPVRTEIVSDPARG